VSYIVIEFLCPAGHRAASLEDRAEVRERRPCECGEVGERTISAPRLKVPVSSVSRGKADERPEGVPDTSLLAEGMPYDEWRSRYTSPTEIDADLRSAARRELDRAS
jgi:hypothetical protein